MSRQELRNRLAEVIDALPDGLSGAPEEHRLALRRAGDLIRILLVDLGDESTAGQETIESEREQRRKAYLRSIMPGPAQIEEGTI